MSAAEKQALRDHAQAQIAVRGQGSSPVFMQRMATRTAEVLDE